MTNKINPYTLAFGQEPKQLISREDKINEILEQFEANEQSQQYYMITGVRGSGKTVLVDAITSKLANNKNWITVELNSSSNLLTDLLNKLSSSTTYMKWFKEAKINLSAFGFDIEISGSSPIYDTETALTKMLNTIKKHGKKVLVTIDDVTNTQYMKKFVLSYQIFIRQKLPLYLLMSGLYENVKDLKDEKNLTFLYRTPNVYLEPLDLYSMAKNYKDNLNVDENTADHMANITKGYSFAFQALGFVTWNNKEFNNKANKDYKKILFDYSYKKIWSELSNQDRKVAYGIARTSHGNYSDILKELHMEKNQLNPYRKRLLEKGIIKCPVRGQLEFTLPYFKEFTIDAYEDDSYYENI